MQEQDLKTMEAKDLGLWMMDNVAGQTASEKELLLQAGRELAGRDDAEALSVAMGTWSLAMASILDEEFFEAACKHLVTKLVELESLPRGAEALTNTARAFADFVAAKGQVSPNLKKLFDAIAESAARLRSVLTSDEWTFISQSLAAGGARLPFGDAAPPQIAEHIRANLKAVAQAPMVVAHGSDDFQVLQIDTFLSESEIAELLRLAEPLWQPSKTYEGAPAVRTSDTAAFRSPELRSHPIVSEVMARAARVVGLPADHCETLQLVRYETAETQYYKEHFDLLDNEEQLLLGGQRVASVLMYLTSVPEGAGGETHFPELENGLKLTPSQGSAVVWPNVDAKGEPEVPLARHAALPLRLPCSKIAVNAWIRAFPGASDL